VTDQVEPRGSSTIRDVAAEAGVSLATVSRVLNAGRSTQDGLATRVLDAAARLNFRPNPAAQGLRRPLSMVGVIVPDLANPYFADVLKGIASAADLANQRMLVADAREDPAEELRLLREVPRWSSGTILCSPRTSTRELTAASSEIARFMTVNRVVAGRAAVVVDFAAGIRQLCSHLRELGHRHVVYLQGPPRAWSDGERQRVLRVEANRGWRVDVLPCGAAITDGHAAADAALATEATAILAFSDYVALGVLLRLNELGLRAPDDVSVAGFDDIPTSRIAGPGLTTASVDKIELGRCAHELLLTGESRRVRIAPSLVLRGSTGRPRTGSRS
jgi:LacI family transcriptional regulator